MYEIYFILLQRKCSERILAFKNQEQAQRICDFLNHGRYAGASAPISLLKVQELTVLEENDLFASVDPEFEEYFKNHMDELWE